MERIPPKSPIKPDDSYSIKVNEILTVPTYFSPEITPYGEITIPDSRPTPLDPEHVYNMPQHDTESYHRDVETVGVNVTKNYIQLAVHELENQLDEAWIIWSTEGVPEETKKYFAEELIRNMEIRCARNATSMGLLARELEHQEKPDDFLEIVLRARNGTADFRELLRLIKEVPKMKSIELFKVVKPLDRMTINQAIDTFDNEVKQLVTTFHDAEFIEYDLSHRDPYVDKETGAVIQKDVIGSLESATSKTEIVRKVIYGAVAVHHRLPGAEKKIHIRDEQGVITQDITARLVPLAVSYYARAADDISRSEREEESAGVQYSSPLGFEPQVEAPNLADASNLDMREVYEKALRITDSLEGSNK